MRIIEDLPDLQESAGTLSLCMCGQSAVVRCDRFIARFSLLTGKIDWAVERTPVRLAESVRLSPRYISLYSAVLWADESTVAEITSTECGGMRVTARDLLTGVQIWEYFVPSPGAAEWAEAAPAWPGAQTEEIYGFIASDPKRLVVCLTRHTRRSRFYSPSVTVDTLPPFACQTDAIRIDPLTGKVMWTAVFDNVHVGIIERRAFAGIWARSPRLGVIDFETGTNTILQELPHSLGWPVYDGPALAVSWHSKDRVGVEWVDKRGRRVRSGSWPQRRVSQTYLHRTDAGLAVQTNDQGLSWLGSESRPIWTVRAKPYIYWVNRVHESDVFVGTDGNGGRLLAFDADSGKETLNLKPALGGVGDMVRIPGQSVLTTTYCVSRSYSVAPQLLIISMMNRRFTLGEECIKLLGTWEHGVVCRTGRDGRHIAVIDLRSPDGLVN